MLTKSIEDIAEVDDLDMQQTGVSPRGLIEACPEIQKTAAFINFGRLEKDSTHRCDQGNMEAESSNITSIGPNATKTKVKSKANLQKKSVRPGQSRKLSRASARKPKSLGSSR